MKQMQNCLWDEIGFCDRFYLHTRPHIRELCTRRALCCLERKLARTKPEDKESKLIADLPATGTIASIAQNRVTTVDYARHTG